MPAPSMQSLVIAGDGRSDPRSVVPSDLLGGVEGQLQSLELFDISLALSVSSYPALGTLRSFSWHSNSLDIDTATFCRILALMPALTTLHLDASRFSWDSHDLVLSEPCALTYLKLSAYSTNILACLQDVGIPCCQIGLCGDGSRELVRGLAEQRLLSVRLGICTDEVVAEGENRPPLTVFGAELVEGAGTMFHFRHSHLSRALFPPLTQLTLSERFWPPADVVLPPLPVLRSLRVVLTPCAAYESSSVHEIRGVLPSLDLAPWDAPLLSTVQLAYCPTPVSCRQARSAVGLPAGPCLCSDMLSVSLLDIHIFVAECLPRAGGTGRRFSELSICGVYPVDPDPWPAYNLLRDMADTFSFSYTAIPTDFELLDCEKMTE
ncbi:hypothetical protein AURDEDRAFT_112789 [Auricularia subglabra TFB-10046 SS5]|nr:hypothetical protein AURDEDRAFT_112789 [Auricularia subglabra TFB-10046 SS5]